MGIPANPTAAPFEVVPMMTYKKKKRIVPVPVEIGEAGAIG
jgi:hypothetical protein